MLPSKSEPALGARPSVAAPRPIGARRTAAKFADPISQVPLAASPARGLPRIPNEIAFLVHYGVSSARLAMAAQKAQAQGVTADRILIAEGFITEDYFYRALARHMRVGFFDGSATLAASARYEAIIATGIARLAPGQGCAFIFAPCGAAISLLIAAATRRPHRPVNFAVTTPRHLSLLARAAARPQIQVRASLALAVADPDLCAKGGLSRHQTLALSALACLAAFASPLAPFQVWTAATTIICLISLATLWLRLSACLASLTPPSPRSRRLSDTELPNYSVIVPLYREARVLPQLLAALNALDYPRAKLDVKIVVEEDDLETLAALRRAEVPPFCEIIIAPDFPPRTKPRALNVALPLLRGLLVTIYDAEDIPDPRQLRLAAEHFAAAGPKLACLQARLAINNLDETRFASSLLTGLFAVEYAGLFRVLNLGLERLGIPFPLGGSSNHFRTHVLRRVGAWDAWNVTEDADIGLRLARFGYQVGCLDSTTYEEAPATLRGFFNQRRRWCKGWYQTLIVLWRSPRRLVRELGALGCAAVTLVVVSNIAGALAILPFLAVLVVDAALGWRALPAGALGDALVGLWIIVLIASVPAVLAPSLIGMKREKTLRCWPVLIWMPAYIAVVCAAAWTAIFDLVRRPHYWHKTDHGAARRV